MIENIVIHNMILEKETLKLKDIIITKLPDCFHTEYTLDCSDSSLTVLPMGLTVEGNLIIKNTKIETLPLNLTVRGDLIMDKTMFIPTDAVIGGQIHIGDKPPYERENIRQTIVFDNSKRFTFFRSETIRSEVRMPDFYQPALTFYERINQKNNFDLASFIENGETYTFYCDGHDEAKRITDYIRAKNRGLEELKGLDINQPRSIDELENIFHTCTGACWMGMKHFEYEFGFLPNHEYSIQDIFNVMKVLPDYYKGIPLWIFYKFFASKVDINYKLV